MITKKYYKLIRVSHEDSQYMRLKNISNEAGIFKMVKTGSPIAPNLEYSLDGVNWTTYDFTTLPEVTVAAGANIYFRGTNADNKFNGRSLGIQYVSFSFNKTCEGHGNMCSLFNPDPTVFSTINYIGQGGLSYLFDAFTTLTTAPDLSNVTSIYQNGLSNCFKNCSSLTTPPNLSNITSIYQNGLQYCFDACTSLTNAPDLSNVTTIGNGALMCCFRNCTSLVTAPDLSNVTTVDSAGLSALFDTCAKLSDVTAPNISDLTANNILSYWLNNTGTQATGTKVVRVPTGATIATGSISGIPTGWTRVDY